MTAKLDCWMDRISIPTAGATITNTRTLEMSSTHFKIAVDRLQGDLFGEDAPVIFGKLDTINQITVFIADKDEQTSLNECDFVVPAMCLTKSFTRESGALEFRNTSRVGYTEVLVYCELGTGLVDIGLDFVRTGTEYLIGVKVN